MRSFFRLLGIGILWCLLLNSTQLFAQTTPVKESGAPLAAKLKPVKSATLKATALSRDFKRLLRVDAEIKTLHAHLKTRGFLPVQGAKHFWGNTESYEQAGKKIISTVRMQDYAKAGSRDAAAVGQVTVTAGDRSQAYSFYLFAPNGNFEAMEEYRIDKKLNILKAHSWWGCVKKDIVDECGTPCLTTLATCAPAASSVVGYVGCVAATCGACALGSIACCACDCSWWCKWATGCCDRSAEFQPPYVPSYKWSEWGSLGGILNSAPAVASWAEGRLDVFVQGTDNALHHRAWFNGNWQGWDRVGGNFVDSPAAVSWGPNRIDVFVRGGGAPTSTPTLYNVLSHIWYDGGWRQWETKGGKYIASAPAVASWGPGRLDVFARGTDNAVWHIWYDGSWHEWESLGGRIVGNPAAVSWAPGRIDVFARGADNALWHKWFDGGWSKSDKTEGWESLGGVITSSPAAASWAAGRLDVFARGTDNTLWHKWFDGEWSKSENTEGWESLGGILTSGPGAVSWGPNRIDVFVRGADNALYHKAWAFQ